MKRSLATDRVNAFCRIMLVFVFLCFVNHSVAQSRIDGKLTDQHGGPISSATITLQDKNSGLVLGYDITDKSGGFVITLDKKTGSNLWLFCNATGFHPDSLQVINQLTGLVIALVPFPKMLPPVTVKNRRSFLNIKPDTSSYKTEDFVQKQDRTIEDVLRKIPGIEIDGSGKISHNGKAISNFYVDGDDIVSGRYSIATRSIRPEMVDKVQVIENHNPIKVLQSATLSNNTALNLNLKPEARMILMGDIAAGAGTHNTYKILADLLSFKKQFKFINQFKTNNTGIDISKDLTPHTIDDLIKKLEQNSPRPFLGLGGTGSPEVGQNRYLFNHTGLLTLNNSFTVKPETQLKLNVHYLYDRQNLSVISRSVYTLPSASFLYDENKQQENRLNSLNAQFTVTTNKKKYYLNNVFSANSANPSGLANTLLNGTAVSQAYNNKNWDVSNELNIISKRSRNITELNSYIRYQHSPENLKLIPGLNDSVFNGGKPYHHLLQYVNLSGWFTHQSISYRIVHDFLVQNYKTGIVLQSQQLASDISITDQSGVVKPLADSFINHLTWNQYKAYFKADYDFVAGHTRLSLSFPLNLHYIQKKQGAGIVPENFTTLTFSPSVHWRYDLNSENNITTLYQFNVMPTGIQENYPNYMLINYMLLQAWKLPVVTNRMHFASLGWSGRRSVKLLSAFVNVGFNVGRNSYLPGFSYLNTLQTRTYIPGIVNTGSQFLNAGISKYIFPLHTTISGKYVLQQNGYEQVQQNQLTRFTDLQQTFSARAQFKIADWLTASYNVLYTTSRSRNRTQDKSPEQKASLLTQQWAINMFPVSDLSVQIGGENYQTRRSNTELASTFFTDVQVVYLLRKYKTEFSLEGINLTGNNEYITATVSANNTRQVNFPLRPSTIMATIRVRF